MSIDTAKFILSIPDPPAQRLAYDDQLSERAQASFKLFHIEGDNDPSKSEPNRCGDCHRSENGDGYRRPSPSGRQKRHHVKADDRPLRCMVLFWPFFVLLLLLGEAVLVLDR
jgi:hypothetical protein